MRQLFPRHSVTARFAGDPVAVTVHFYAIARLVVFQDPFVAEARPDLAVKDATTGDLWRNDIGLAWVDAFHE